MGVEGVYSRLYVLEGFVFRKRQRGGQMCIQGCVCNSFVRTYIEWFNYNRHNISECISCQKQKNISRQTNGKYPISRKVHSIPKQVHTCAVFSLLLFLAFTEMRIYF